MGDLQNKFGVTREQLAEKLAKVRVLVVGDVMLDRYWFGDATRISPEAPVPVAKIERMEERAGGAANVARNIASLGGKATLLSVTGDDEAGQTLSELMRESGVEPRLKLDSSINTTVKLRVIARQQQLIRLDFENTPSKEILADKFDEYVEIINEHDLIIMSDYGKGGLTHVRKMIDVACKAKKPVLVDPKGDDYILYRGATLLTPNRTELRQVVGSWLNEEDLNLRAHALRRQLKIGALLVTRSEEGMSLFSGKKIQGKSTLHVATQAQEVYDVSGAGDTVIASLGLALASGLDMAYALQIANTAAGIVVGKLGTATCSQEDLFSFLEN